tara:strand:- start:290 stop:673 length:384 start_codon:yes stop_codon:yes gene_type:complete
MKRLSRLLAYKKNFLGWFVALILIVIAIFYGIDKKIILFTAFIVTIFTEIFAGISALVAMIPFIGPLIIKVISFPVFWILNALGTLVSGLAIKKGYTTKLAKGRIITLALLIGIIIGYIMGHIIPLK